MFINILGKWLYLTTSFLIYLISVSSKIGWIYNGNSNIFKPRRNSFAVSRTNCNIQGTKLFKSLRKFVADVYSILKRTHLKTFFHYIKNLHSKFISEEKNNG